MGGLTKWDRRDNKRKQRMRTHGRSFVKVYKDSILKRLRRS